MQVGFFGAKGWCRVACGDGGCRLFGDGDGGWPGVGMRGVDTALLLDRVTQGEGYTRVTVLEP